MSQNDRIIRHLGKGNTLTQLGALRLCGCLRLSERIRELKAQHWPIKSEMVNVGGKRVARYLILRARAHRQARACR